MTDTRRVLSSMAYNGYSYRKLAGALGLSPRVLSEKINNRRDFKQSEILKMVELLGCDLTVFFGQNC